MSQAGVPVWSRRKFVVTTRQGRQPSGTGTCVERQISRRKRLICFVGGRYHTFRKGGFLYQLCARCVQSPHRRMVDGNTGGGGGSQRNWCLTL